MPLRPPVSSRFRAAPLTAAAAAAVLLTALPARAQEAAEAGPYYLGASLGAYHSSNVYQQASGGSSDTILSSSLLAGLDKRFGRQRLFVDASVQHNRYQQNSRLNHLGYNLRGGLEWATVGNLSGEVSADLRRSLADYNVGGIQPIFVKNTEDNRQLQAIARLGLVTKLTLEGTLTHRDRRFSAVEYDSLEYRQNAGSLGLFYKPSEPLRLGVALRHTRGEYPHYRRLSSGATQADEFSRNDLDLSAEWNPSSAHSLDARVSVSRSTHDAASARNLRGLTGALAWAWRPGGRLSLQTRIARDSGIESYYLGVGNLSADYTTITTSFQTRAVYELSHKLQLEAGFSYGRADRDNSLLATQANDHTRSYSVGLRWQPRRALELGCNLTQQTRDSTVPGYAYDARTYGCYIQGILR
ncbi:outer membrane beta-barrel protein [Pelomonas sp. CA6]|uniref:outer membrane beta-barrel protein n=1 Tax=Pelomonas sp. CA6 TaxID=2907999 RepID=UPI001F4BD0F8|nr:outer membrane beta-barrel protein [Pelomonas sp. CA6]MCH7343722.1 outer membrane beta-barrel protein [Pelomonas sp. CA6]